MSKQRDKLSASDVEDLSLAIKAGKGDQFAFEQIYRKHHRKVYSLCLRILKETDTAEDITQELFIQVYRKIHTFKGDAKFSTWLHKTTVNQALMYLRKIKNQEQVGVNADTIEIESDRKGYVRPAKVIEQIDLERAIEQLPEGYFKVFVLHDIEGWDHSEVAKILGISVGTSKSQLHKARLKLKKLVLKNRFCKDRLLLKTA